MRFELIDAIPVTSRVTIGFRIKGGRCDLGQVQVRDYHPTAEGQRLRELRTKLGMSLREAARALRMRDASVSGLESGALLLATKEDWQLLYRALKEGKRAAPRRWR